MIATLNAHVDIKRHDEDWISYKKGQGEQAFSKYISELNELQDHVLPYLQQYCSLPEQEPIKTASTAKREKQQLSIHDRLEKNKEVLEKSREKILRRKGLSCKWRERKYLTIWWVVYTMIRKGVIYSL